MHRFIPAMASIAGPRIAEIKVRHHARQFGQSKYGLSRIYKVLLDLHGHQDGRIVHVAAAAVVQHARDAAARARHRSRSATRCGAGPTAEAGIPLPVAGTGVLLLTSAFILVCGGVLGELIYRFGDVRERDFSRLTGTTWRSDTAPDPGDCA